MELLKLAETFYKQATEFSETLDESTARRLHLRIKALNEKLPHIDNPTRQLLEILNKEGLTTDFIHDRITNPESGKSYVVTEIHYTSGRKINNSGLILRHIDSPESDLGPIGFVWFPFSPPTRREKNEKKSILNRH